MTNDAPPRRLLLGPGPSPLDDRVAAMLAAPMVGHLDPYFVGVMAEIRRLLRYVFQTENELTLAISGTGTSAMDAAMTNLVEPGSTVAVCICGYFGERLAQIAERNGARVLRIEADWGRAVEAGRLIAALDDHPEIDVVALVHAETSTGVLQPLDDIVEALSGHEALLVVDAVTSLGAHPVDVDPRRIDICYSGSQKALGAPPGMAPITVSPRALDRIRKRATPPPAFALDLEALAAYWCDAPAYHHTAPIPIAYALLEALRQVEAEGREARYLRHRLNSRALVAGLEGMGLSLLPAPAHRLHTLHAVRVPDGIDEERVRRRLLDDYNIEIGAGMGPLKGRIWRVGLMGAGSTRANVVFFLGALECILRDELPELPSGLDPATAVYEQEGFSRDS
jgi:alanine-glyoxylate transaminase/serine-glyoxylate transaminase/serine-pyruvate transaminase